MRKTLEISYGKGLKINRGSYNQDSPMWHEKLTIELNGETPEEVKALEETEYLKIKERIDRRANEEWNRTALELAGLRVRVKDGKKFPGVTSILKPEPYTGNPEYGARGTEIHRICNEFIDTGKWSEPTIQLEKISFEQIKYQEFFAKHEKRLDFKKHKKNIEVFNDKWLYSGEVDLICSVDGLWTLCDLKTGGWDWPQLVAYEKCGGGKVKQLAVFDLKTGDIHTLEVGGKEYQENWEEFIFKRGEFKARFGI